MTASGRLPSVSCYIQRVGSGLLGNYDESISSRVVEAVRLHPDSNETWPLETIAYFC